jgi:hypothetical protein
MRISLLAEELLAPQEELGSMELVGCWVYPLAIIPITILQMAIFPTSFPPKVHVSCPD